MVYSIFEGNMERLEKKLRTIENKCKKYGCEFHYERVGEEFREVVDKESGEKVVAKFVLVEAEGKAQVSGWRFAASIDHTEKGNIIESAGGLEIPERYYDSELYCEHCKSRRSRKHVFIVYNEENNEFKQVGRSCLHDFTNGLSAEAVAQYLSWFEELVQGEAVSGCGYSERYFDTKDVLRYIAETIRHFGYERSGGYGTGTGAKAFRYYRVDKGIGGRMDDDEKYRAEMNSVGFDAYSGIADEAVEAALKWLETQEESSNYMHNLKVAAALEWMKTENLNLLASLFPVYNKNLEREAMRREAEAKAHEEGARSEWQGVVGKRIEFDAEEISVITSWSTQWGMVGVYKLVDAEGNVYTWKTSNYVDVERKYHVVGTVKEHKEYREVKQTELTRCKTTLIKEVVEKPEVVEIVNNDIDKALDMLYDESVAC